MGCGGSTPEEVQEVQQAGEYQNSGALQNRDHDDIRFDLARAEAKAVEAGPEKNTFLGSVLAAREGHDDDAGIMEECCTKLQAHNGKLKSLIATADAEAVKEAMDGGFLGMGCNHKKLMAVLCSRTKSQLEMTRKRYRAMYDLDMREDVNGDTSGTYGKMISCALSSKDEYVMDMIDKACGGWGCDETILVELFCMCEQDWLKAGKQMWEGRKDKSLIDYLNGQLGSSYKDLCKLLLMLLKGDINNEDMEVDDDAIKAQVEAVRAQTTKSGWFRDPEVVDALIDIIGANNTAQNCRLAELYENAYNESLGKSIKSSCADKIGWCLSSLLLPRPDFVASRIKKAQEGWFTDKMTLVRLLGGLDGRKMVGVLDAYEAKYGLPLASALNQEIGGNFADAALLWIRALDDPSGGVEEVTEKEPSEFSGDAPKLSNMCDFLLLENEMLLRFAASLDMETLAEAIKGWGTDDTRLIRTLTTRSKRFLGRLSYMYRETAGETLSGLVDSNCNGWYAYLAKFLVLQPSQSDALLLDIALEGDSESADTNALIEFLCARHPRRVRAAKKTWERRTDEYLVDALSDKLSGDLRTIALTMLKGKRNQDDVDEETANMKLAKAQAKMLNDDMSKAIEVLCSNSPAQNAAIARQYEEKYDSSLSRALGQEFDGNVKAALKALLLEPAAWYAQRLKASFKGLSASDRTVCRIVGAHDKDEIKAIAAAYDDKYGQTLKSAIQQHCTGDYRRLAVAWIDLPDQLEQPAKLIELPRVEDEEPPPPPAEEPDDDELEEEDVDNLPDPSSVLYKAKVLSWSKRLEEAEANGQTRRIAYLRRLLVMYPPLPSGHQILRDYVSALEDEYKKGNTDLTDVWIASTPDATFEEAGTTKDIFDEWQNTSEKLIKEKLITLSELKSAWGVNKKPEKPPEPATQDFEKPYEAPKPAAGGGGLAMGTVMGSPPQPQMPAMMLKQPSNMRMVQQFGQGMGMHQHMQTSMMTQTHTFQQTIVQPPQPAVRKMAATVPWGYYGGMQMTVNTPHGQMRVTIPPGYGPGSSFTFNVPVQGGGGFHY